MSTKTNATPDSTTPVRAPWRISGFSLHSDFRLQVMFNDGKEGIVDLNDLIHGQHPGVYAPLADPAFFVQARLELGTITWPNGVDLDPDWLHDEIVRNGVWKAS